MVPWVGRQSMRRTLRSPREHQRMPIRCHASRQRRVARSVCFQRSRARSLQLSQAPRRRQARVPSTPWLQSLGDQQPQEPHASNQEIAQELLQLRRWLANLIQIESEVELERIWATDLGDRYWALVRSGVQKEPLDQEDQAIIATATQRLSPESGGGFGKPAALNAFLVAMMYYMPGGMRVDSPEHKIPGWLLEPYRQVFEQMQAAL